MATQSVITGAATARRSESSEARTLPLWFTVAVAA
jgi:hypothetical protein